MFITFQLYEYNQLVANMKNNGILYLNVKQHNRVILFAFVYIWLYTCIIVCSKGELACIGTTIYSYGFWVLSVTQLYIYIYTIPLDIAVFMSLISYSITTCTDLPTHCKHLIWCHFNCIATCVLGYIHVNGYDIKFFHKVILLLLLIACQYNRIISVLKP